MWNVFFFIIIIIAIWISCLNINIHQKISHKEYQGVLTYLLQVKFDFRLILF